LIFLFSKIKEREKKEREKAIENATEDVGVSTLQKYCTVEGLKIS
jgi:hypothetical protein